MASTNKSDFEQRCRFPAVVIYDDAVTAYETVDNFVRCRTIDIRAGQRGRFARSRLLDFYGQLWHLDGATVAHGLGLFWGWRLFSRSVRAGPTIISGPEPADLDIIRRELVRLLPIRDSLGIVVHSFCTTIRRGDARRLIPQIESATTAGDIIGALLGADFPERERVFHDQPAA